MFVSWTFILVLPPPPHYKMNDAVQWKKKKYPRPLRMQRFVSGCRYVCEQRHRRAHSSDTWMLPTGRTCKMRRQGWHWSRRRACETFGNVRRSYCFADSTVSSLRKHRYIFRVDIWMWVMKTSFPSQDWFDFYKISARYKYIDQPWENSKINFLSEKEDRRANPVPEIIWLSGVWRTILC